AMMLIVLSAAAEPRANLALPMLIPIALLGAAEIDTLKRGLSGALDWFGILSFGLLAVLVWGLWAESLWHGLPAPVAHLFRDTQPGFQPPWQWLPVLVSLFLTLLWVALVRPARRSNRRAVLNWAAGMTLVWGLFATIWLPYVDSRRSYRPVAESLAVHLPADSCLASRNLGEPQGALLEYFAGVITKRGEHGRGADQYGRGAEDIVLRMPVGTLITDADTGERVADLAADRERALIARGGKGGLGNIHFKSSTNRAPRQATPGEAGEQRRLKLELKVLADVGLLGMPNAGKSTLIRAVSAARPRVADYPFTTLAPHLGVVRADVNRSFVVADIPGLIEGAAEGAGLGHRFLRHLQRTRLLLHVVDLAPLDGETDPVADARAIVKELKLYDEALHGKPRWL